MWATLRKRRLTMTKKSRFKFSLLTFLVAVNVAGLLVWANVFPRYDEFESPSPNGPVMTKTFQRGWPILAVDIRWTEGASTYKRNALGSFWTHWLDAGLSFLILALVMATTELLVLKFRRPGVTQPNSPTGPPQEPVDA